MTKLQSLFAEFGQSPWLDNLSRPYLQDGTLRRLVGDGIRGVTANPTILARAIEGTAAYDEQFAALVRSGLAVPDAYWELVVDDIAGALAVLRRFLTTARGPMASSRWKSLPSWPTTPSVPWPPLGASTSASPPRTCSSRSRPRPRES